MISAQQQQEIIKQLKSIVTTLESESDLTSQTIVCTISSLLGALYTNPEAQKELIDSVGKFSVSNLSRIEKLKSFNNN